jgi:hypothetical protein
VNASVASCNAAPRLSDPDFVRSIVHLNVLQVRRCPLLCACFFSFVTLNQLSLQTMHDLECFINLCVCSAINPACVCRFSTLHPPLLQPRLQVRLRVRREPRLRPHREMDQKRLCGATSTPLQPQRVVWLLYFVFSRVPLSVLDEPRDPSVPPAAAAGFQTLTTSVQRFIHSRRTYTHVAEACKTQQAKALRCRLSPQCIRVDPSNVQSRRSTHQPCMVPRSAGLLFAASSRFAPFFYSDKEDWVVRPMCHGIGVGAVEESEGGKADVGRCGADV